MFVKSNANKGIEQTRYTGRSFLALCDLMKSRRAIICLSIVSLGLCLLMGIMWVRSYDTADRIHGRLWGKHSFVVASKQGRLTIIGFLWHGASNSWVWQMRRYSASDVMFFPVGDMRQYEKQLGFGIIRQPIYFVMHPTQETPQGTISFFGGAASTTLRGSGVIVPHWFLVLMTVMVSVFTFKKISTFVAFISVIIGAIIGGYQIIHRIQEHKETSEQIKMYLEAGEKFVEQFKLDRAIEEYQKVLTREKDNIEAHRRIITAKLLKIELNKFNRIGYFPEINDILSQIYQLQALNQNLKNDIKLLLQEARLLIYDESLDNALKVLERARKLSPSDPEVLALLGHVHVLNSQKDRIESLDLLRQAIQIRPNEALYHYYLANAFKKAKQDADAIREYHKAAKLLTGQDIWSYRLRNNAFYELDNIFMRFFREDGALTPHLDMPLEERAHIYEYLLEQGKSSGSSLEHDGRGYLATIYYELRDYEKAHQEIKNLLDKWSVDYKVDVDRWKDYGRWVHWYELHIKILEESGLDPKTLAEARKYVKAIRDELKRREEAEKYLEILEVFRHGTYGNRYKIGLKVLNIESDEGVLVLHVFEGYPFEKAGVRKGDMILEIAHRKTRNFYDIKQILTKFELGNNIPIKVKHGNDILFLTLIIE